MRRNELRPQRREILFADTGVGPWTRWVIRFCAAIAIALLAAATATASEINLPPDAKQAMGYIYSGQPEAALPIAHQIEESQPDDPLGYLIEAEADWWNIYCAACQVKWGMVDDFAHGKRASHDAYLALADKVISLAKTQIEKSDTAEMHVYAGLGYALKARLYDERDEHRNVARAGVAARAEFLRALQIDPDTPDATAGLGLYNYYVDSLSAIVKVLRFFMGIPGGDKAEGIRQMKEGAAHGVLFAVDTRYYLAKNLRTFDLRYADALEVAQPLVQTYPRNPIFLLLVGNLNTELGRKEKAAQYFHETLDAPTTDAACADRVKEIANSFLKTLN
jgi:tetratricopeptide (TPR) repeat protein